MVQEERGRLDSSREAGTAGREHQRSGSTTDGVAAAALVYFNRLGHLASCTADIRWALQTAITRLPDSMCICPAYNNLNAGFQAI